MAEDNNTKGETSIHGSRDENVDVVVNMGGNENGYDARCASASYRPPSVVKLKDLNIASTEDFVHSSECYVLQCPGKIIPMRAYISHSL